MKDNARQDLIETFEFLVEDAILGNEPLREQITNKETELAKLKVELQEKEDEIEAYQEIIAWLKHKPYIKDYSIAKVPHPKDRHSNKGWRAPDSVPTLCREILLACGNKAMNSQELWIELSKKGKSIKQYSISPALRGSPEFDFEHRARLSYFWLRNGATVRIANELIEKTTEVPSPRLCLKCGELYEHSTKSDRFHPECSPKRKAVVENRVLI